MRYYMVIGKDKHIPKTYYTKAKNLSYAKQHFYIDSGDSILIIVSITKELYKIKIKYNETKN